MGKRSKSKSNTSPKAADDVPAGEDRFAAAETRPQFKAPKASDTKVVLDDRFSSVLTDPRFQLEQKDKYGRKKKKKGDRNAAKEELESFYIVEEKEKKDVDDKSDDDDGKAKPEKPINSDDDSSDSDSDSENSEVGKAEDPVSRISYLTALSRGEIDGSSSDEDDDSSQSSSEEDDSDGEDSVYGTAGVLDPSTEQSEEIEISYDSSPYLVVTNMDWENIRAVDLFSILSSFTPPGAIKKVQVFESDFGMEQMAKEKLNGPSGIWQKSKGAKKKDTPEEHPSDDEESDSDEEHSESGENKEIRLNYEEEEVPDESDFDPEKLRAYEASKLKYYFAVTEFSQPDYADIVYREVDGMEFEHSSTAIDLRTLPVEALESVVANRPMRDQATSIPGKYEPPEFIVSALQQTNVQCTWDQGDKEREKKLTNYGSSNWHESFEEDDLKAYIASDASSDEDSDDDDDGDGGKAGKRSMMRKALGLDSASDNDSGEGDDSSAANSSESDGDDDEGATMSKQIRIMPGKKDLEERIRSKLEPKEETKELTPWEKYQEKRKQKRKERRQAARGKKPDEGSSKNSSKKDMPSRGKDDFFGSDDDADADFEAAKRNKNGKNKHTSKEQKTKEQLELLLAGEDAEEEARDYDIRGIQRMEKNKGKKLKGSRKRKEAKIAAEVSGSNFKVNVRDDRFQAVLDGSDARFGIDKTDPNYRDTAAMREILSEQTTRRKNKRQKKAHDKDTIVPDVNANGANKGKSSGASALSFLVRKLKTQVNQNKN
mmetsp:Transcript_31985/g.75232  ORF Transcript_31985/g.75232 Transcript_31985/m.75232 type:complete len:770 (-) Transcript_31985:49-2358(-)